MDLFSYITVLLLRKNFMNLPEAYFQNKNKLNLNFLKNDFMQELVFLVFNQNETCYLPVD